MPADHLGRQFQPVRGASLQTRCLQKGRERYTFVFMLGRDRRAVDQQYRHRGFRKHFRGVPADTNSLCPRMGTPQGGAAG